MAEYVRGRILAAKVGVTMAFLGLLGGTTAVASRLFTSKDIKDHSLLRKDFKSGQIPDVGQSKVAYEFIKHQGAEIFGWYEKHSGDFDLLSQKIIDAGSALEQKITTASENKYLHKDDSAVNADKIDGLDSSQLVLGDGSVRTGVQNLTFTGPITTTPDVEVSAAPGATGKGATFTIKNVSGNPISYSWSADGQHSGGVSQPGATFTVTLADLADVGTVQFTGGVRPSQVGTITLGTLLPAVQGSPGKATAQILMGE